MKQLLYRSSQMLLVVGLMSLLFGILVFAWPDITLVTLVWMFATLVLFHGISHVIASLQFRSEEVYWWVLMLIGILYIAGGLFAIIFPIASATFVILIMALTWFATGVVEVIAAIRLRKEIENEGWLILAGILSIIAGIYVFANPHKGALALLWLIALYASLFGIFLMIFGWRARNWVRKYDRLRAS